MKVRSAVPALLLVALLVAPGLLALRLLAQADKKAAGPLPRPVTAGTRSEAPFLAGTASCSAGACHGGSQAEKKLIQQNEFSTWLAHDKHARAYQVLLDERGQRIGRNLGVEAHKDERCLACHVTTALASKDTKAEFVPLRADGVGCEACHGPARSDKPWLYAHTTESWQKNPDRRKVFADHQMTYLADLETQARTCAGCHVGAPADPTRGIPARDCNHDIMAAGHPRLNFELGAFRWNQPPHWRRDKYSNKEYTRFYDPGYEAKTWAVGQAVAAQASLDLLRHRATLANADKDKAVWPEFAEYDCFTCHADFGTKSWRQNKAYYGQRKPGSLPYSRWFSAMVPALKPLADDPATQLGDDFAALDKEMSRPYPAAGKIIERVNAAQPHVQALIQAATQGKYDDAKVKALLAAARARKEDVKVMRWEEAQQWALALAALAGDIKQDDPLGATLKALVYPTGYESPALNHPEKTDKGSSETRRTELDDALEKLLK